MDLPRFRYHPDPVRTGSVVASGATCRCCRKARGYVYDGPVYSEEDDLDGQICPWCIADGSAHEKFDATFVDTEGFADGTPDTVIDEITQRTPGYAAWQSEHWPSCCNDAMAFLGPLGIAEIRAQYRQWEGLALNHIIYEMQISGGAALRMLESLNRDKGPTAYLFRCLHCGEPKFHIDHT